jgi:membrane protease YdiL (CAAX protease family)
MHLSSTRSLWVFLAVTAVLSGGFVGTAMILGKKANFLIGFYMLTPAIAALITRGFFYEGRFRDAHLRLGKIRDYFAFWAVGIGITLVSLGMFTVLGSVTWDFTGQSFLQRMAEQLQLESADDLQETLPDGMTPEIMLWLFFAGGLTTFNLLPGLIFGWGEEFGWRGFLFPALYRIRPWLAFVAGGAIWYVWHLPLGFIQPDPPTFSALESVLNHLALLVASMAAFFFFAYVYVKSRSIWVVSLAHVTQNNAASSFSYFLEVESQFLANLGLALTIVLVAAGLWITGEWREIPRYFSAPLNRAD